MITAQEAFDLIARNSVRGPVEIISIVDPRARGLVLAEDIRADRDLPPFHRSQMDGFAVRSEDVNSGMEQFRIVGQRRAGATEEFIYQKGDALEIMTGAAVPEFFDAVFTVETSTRHGDASVSFSRKNAEPGFNISIRGEDIQTGEIALKAGSRIDSTTFPVLSSVGAGKVSVFSRPRVSIVSTGDEIVGIDDTPGPHHIREGSSLAIADILSSYGIEVQNKIMVHDDRDAIYEVFEKCSKDSDLILVTGAVSMGVTDNVPELLVKCGYNEIFHNVKVKPGKPLWFGVSNNGQAAFGLPGNPVSSQVSARVFVSRWIREWMGLGDTKIYQFPIAEDKRKKHDREEYRQCYLRMEDGQAVLYPQSHHGSGDFIHLSGTDGLLVHPADVSDIAKGDPVDFIFWKER